MITALAALALSPAVVTDTLANGARVVAIPVPEARTFSVQAFIRIGSLFESADSNGASHLLEHLLFADGKADRLAEGAGFLLNATTYREFMRLHAQGPESAWKAGVASIAQLLKSPDYSTAEKEWQVIRQENELALLDPHERAIRSLLANSPWSRLPMGDTSKSTPQRLRELFEKHFVGGNIVIVLAGKFESGDAIAEIRNAFTGLRKGEPAQLPASTAAELQPRAVSEAGVAVGAVGPGWDRAKDYLAFEVAATALTAPLRLQASGLDSRNHFAPSSSGSPAVLTFVAADGAPGLATRVSRTLAQPITESEFADARVRVLARYSDRNPSNLATIEGLAILLTGGRIDFPKLVATLTKSEVDKAAEAFRK